MDRFTLIGVVACSTIWLSGCQEEPPPPPPARTIPRPAPPRPRVVKNTAPPTKEPQVVYFVDKAPDVASNEEPVANEPVVIVEGKATHDFFNSAGRPTMKLVVRAKIKGIRMGVDSCGVAVRDRTGHTLRFPMVPERAIGQWVLNETLFGPTRRGQPYFFQIVIQRAGQSNWIPINRWTLLEEAD